MNVETAKMAVFLFFMEPKPLSLQFQHTACEKCVWQAHAQTALDSLIKGNEPIESASIRCTQENESHARVKAIALAAGRDPDSQQVYPLVVGVLSCRRREVDPDFNTPSSPRAHA